MPKLATLILTVTLALALAALPGPVRAGSCSSRGAELEIEVRSGRIFNLRRSGEDRYYACLYSVGQKFFLTQDRDNSSSGETFWETVDNTKINDHYAALTKRTRQGDEASTRVIAISAKTGRSRVSIAADTGTRSSLASRRRETTDLEMTADGWLAWFEDVGSTGEVHAYDSEGHRLLSEAADENSLRRSGDVVRWRENGVSDSVTLR